MIAERTYSELVAIDALADKMLKDEILSEVPATEVWDLAEAAITREDVVATSARAMSIVERDEGHTVVRPQSCVFVPASRDPWKSELGYWGVTALVTWLDPPAWGRYFYRVDAATGTCTHGSAC